MEERLPCKQDVEGSIPSFSTISQKERLVTDQSMFNEDNGTPETPAQPHSGSLEDKLKDIRNESGEQKYKDVETALEALKNSQQFIEQLKREKREIEERHNKTQSELEKMGAIDDYVKRLQPQNAPADPQKETPKGDGGLSEERVAQLLEERLSAREQQLVQAANLKQVEDQLKQTYGDNSATFLKQRATELSMSITDLKELAMKTPSAALALLGQPNKKPIVPTQSSVIPNRQLNDQNEPPKFERSTVHGGLTAAEMKDRWNQSKSYTNKRLGVE